MINSMPQQKLSAEEMLGKFKKIKSLPHVAIHLAQLLNDENTTIYDLEEVIRLDPTLVLRLMRHANSPYYGLMQKVESITETVTYLGLKNLHKLIVLEALKDIFTRERGGKYFSKQNLWLHSAVVSICSQMISERFFQENGENAFLCGILHDVGMIIEYQVAPKLFIKMCKMYQPGIKSITMYEQDIIGTDHSKLGYLLAKDWNLAPEIMDAIRNHHNPLDNILPSDLCGIVQIAEFLVAKLNYTAIKGEIIQLAPSLLGHIKDNIDEYKILIKDLPEEIEKAKEIYQA